jgi:hypothetical protein
MPRTRKLDLEKIKATLTIACPHCLAILAPQEWQQVDGERAMCRFCDGLFVPSKKTADRKYTAGRRFPLICN